MPSMTAPVRARLSSERPTTASRRPTETMSVQAILRILALLAVVAEAGVVTIAAAWVFRAAGWSRRLRRDLAPWALWAATAVAAVSMAGSLWFSEYVGFVPCTLCWYQRIAMYPLVIVLGVAAIRRDVSVWLPATIIAGIGGSISILHLFEQWGPHLDLGVCETAVPCSARWVTEFGYLTIPGMALSGFALIIALLSLTTARSASRPLLDTTARSASRPLLDSKERA